MKTKKYPCVRHPERFDLILYLIREELKSRKFFSGLQRLGLDYCFYQPHLDKPILAAVGFDDPSEEVYKFYFKVIEKRSRKIREDEESITMQARKVWKTLVHLSDRRNLVGEELQLKETRDSHVAA
jgi:hypothetical protein